MKLKEFMFVNIKTVITTRKFILKIIKTEAPHTEKEIRPPNVKTHTFTRCLIKLSISTLRAHKKRLPSSTVCVHKPYPHNPRHIFYNINQAGGLVVKVSD
jgi:hypothetical protein